MAITVEIHPSSDSVLMFDEPETSTAYSLSGHVSISLSSSASYFEKARTVKALLRSLSLTFEGYQEIITHETGYAASRLCSFTRELAPVQAMLLTNDGHEDSGRPCTWNFVFNFPIPGWLPTSSDFGSDAHGPAGTRYALFAEAKFVPIDEGRLRGWSLSSLCSPWSPKESVVQAPMADIQVVRYMLPPASSEPNAGFPEATYMIETRYDSIKNIQGSSRIPKDVLSKVEVLASVPECIGLDEDSLMLTIRLRANDLSPEQRKRLKLSEFEVKLNQHERFSTVPSRSYTSSFPLPSAQPDTKPLLNPHPLKTMFDICLLAPLDSEHERFTSQFSLLPSKHAGRHRLAGAGVLFAQEAQRASDLAWCKLEVRIPFMQLAPGDDAEWECKHGRVKALRASEASPLFGVQHEIEVELTCTYDTDAEDGEADLAKERLVFGLPVTFARLPPVKAISVSQPQTPTYSPASSVSSLQSTAPVTPCQSYPPSPTSSLPNAFALPPYSQLFHPNGDRRIDYSVPLPAYTPRASLKESAVGLNTLCDEKQ